MRMLAKVASSSKLGKLQTVCKANVIGVYILSEQEVEVIQFQGKKCLRQ